MEDARVAASDGGGEGGAVEDVGLAEEEVRGVAAAGEGAEMGGVGAGLDGRGDGVTLLEEGADQPTADEAITAGDAHTPLIRHRRRRRSWHCVDSRSELRR